MDLALFGRYFLDFALLYPSAFLCLASLWEKLRTPRAPPASLPDALPCCASAAPHFAPCSG